MMRMCVLLRDGFTALDIVGGYEVLANLPGMEVEFAAPRKGLVWADTRSLALQATRTYGEVQATDILYVPGGPGVTAGLDDPDLIETIDRLHHGATWTVGICNGVEWLGKAGVIRGKEVTTNWAVRDKVATYGATVNHKRFHRDGKIVTGAGVSASIDAALFLADLIAGRAVAETLQLGIEYYPQPPFGAATPDEAPAAAQAFIRQYEAASPRRIAAMRIPG